MKSITFRASRLFVAALVSAVLLPLVSGCATPSDPRDPLEPFNRGAFRFNEQVDMAVVQPASRGYRAVVPQFVRTSVSNVFANVGDVRNALNNALQGKLATAYGDMGRVLINSSLGLLGLFDVASEAGIEKHNEDFGQTLGAWGLGGGTYIVLPIFGPSSTRDLVGTAVDYATDPLSRVDPSRAQAQLRGARAFDARAELIEAGEIVHDAALDPYAFVRDAYLQRRRNLVFDGRPDPTLEQWYAEVRADRGDRGN